MTGPDETTTQDPPVSPSGPIPVSHTGRWTRLTVSALVCLGLLWGTFWGQDDAFPIGPFRMYSTRQRLDGRVSWYEVRRVAADGTETLVSGSALGMRRAEIEGQRPRLVDDPELLCLVATASSPGAEIVEVRLVKRSRPLVDGRLTGETVDEVVQRCTP